MTLRGLFTRGLLIEFAIIIGVSIVSGLVLVRIDLFDKFYEFTRSHESWELDEVALALPVLAVGLFIFALRRAWETGKENQARLAAEQQARAAEAKIMAVHKMKEEFMMVMGHELRTPLNAVLATLSYLKAEAMDESQSDLVDIAQSSAKSLDSLLNNIMEFFQLDGKSLEIPTDRFHPASVLRSTRQTLMTVAQAKGVRMPEPEVDGLPELVLGQEGVCRQVLFNLAGNAVKFTEQGSVTISGRFEPRGKEKGMLVLEVADTGPGIAAQDLDTIFEPFTQLDQSLQRKQGGIGLGLSLVKRMVDLTGGKVEVESEPGKGSAFRVSLPVIVTELGAVSEESALTNAA